MSRDAIDHKTNECCCEGKKCNKCEKVQCYGAFSRNKSAKDGLQAKCRQCQKKYQEENKERIKARRREYYQSHKEQSDAYSSAWRKANPEKTKVIYQKTRKKLRENPEYREKLRARSQERYWENHKYHQTYREENREWFREYNETYRKQNHAYFASREANRRAVLRGNGGTYTQQEWDSLKAQYDHTCLKCGRQEPEIALSADHIVPIKKGGRNDISNIQPLCKSCNSRKHTSIIDYRVNYQQKSEDMQK